MEIGVRCLLGTACRLGQSNFAATHIPLPPYHPHASQGKIPPLLTHPSPHASQGKMHQTEQCASGKKVHCWKLKSKSHNTLPVKESVICPGDFDLWRTIRAAECMCCLSFCRTPGWSGLNRWQAEHRSTVQRPPD